MKYVKNIKKLLSCLLALTLLCSSQLTYVSAATVSENTAEVVVIPRDSNPKVVVEKSGLTITFHFSYVDGSSAEYKEFTVGGALASLYNVTLDEKSFNGDRAKAVVIATNKRNGDTIRFEAWCNIYGETGSN